VSPKTGRPKGVDPIEKQLTVRLNADTEKRLLEYCKQHNVSRAEAVRRGIHLLTDEKE
jgi:hypothetical protein